MAALRSSVRDVESLLSQFQTALSSESPEETGLRLIEDISTVTLRDLATEIVEYAASLLLDVNSGLLNYLQRAVSDKTKNRTCIESLKFISAFIKKHRNATKTYADSIKDTCLHVYTRASAAQLKSKALETLSDLLLIPSIMNEISDTEALVAKLCQELPKPDNQLKPSVKHSVLLTLGVLSEVSPSTVQSISDDLADKVIGLLHYQMSRAKSPENSLISGCFLFLNRFLSNFDRSEHPTQVDKVFECIAKGIDPSTIQNRVYVVHRAALDVLAKHGEQFQTQLIKNYQEVYHRLKCLGLMRNRDISRSTTAAIEIFFKQIGASLAEPPTDLTTNQRKQIFSYLMKELVSMIRGDESTVFQVAQAVRCYGFFAAALKEFEGEEQVELMFSLLLEKAVQFCNSDRETEEDKMITYPSFLQSLALIIKQIDKLQEAWCDSVVAIFVRCFDTLPRQSSGLRFVTMSATSQLFAVLCDVEGRGSIMRQRLLDNIVEQAVMRTCLGSPVTEDNLGDNPGDNNESLADKIITYKDFTDFWTYVLSHRSRQMMNGDITHRLVYYSVISMLLRIIESLDLSHQPANEDQEPAYNKPRDIKILYNISEFFEEVFVRSNQVEKSAFSEWAYNFCVRIIKLSNRCPLASPFYKLLTHAMSICEKVSYFEEACSDSQMEVDGSQMIDNQGVTCRPLVPIITSFQNDLIGRMRMQDSAADLQIATLYFILSVPIQIISCPISRLTGSIQSALTLGLSYPPLISLCLKTLRLWKVVISPSEFRDQLKVVMPFLDKLLRSEDTESPIAGDKMSETSTKKTGKGLDKAVKSYLRQTTQTSVSPLRRLKLQVLQFLGEIEGKSIQSLVRVDRSEGSRLAVSWDSNKHLKFDFPFPDTSATVYLDNILPRVCELALSSSSRQVKVAACELLHSLVLLLLGRGATLTPDMQKKSTAHHVFSKLFPVLLELAVDVEQVTKQLFEPLMIQMIHWFTKSPHAKETEELRSALMEGLISDSKKINLKEFSARCIQEFMKWSIKQTSVEQQKRNPEAVKTLLKHMYSWALHPSVVKRAAAALIFNHIYRLLREEESLIEQFTLEILIAFIQSLAIQSSSSQATESEEGHEKTARECLQHCVRMIQEKTSLFNSKSGLRRVPRGWTDNSLLSVLLWLLENILATSPSCRHASMELIVKLSPNLPQEYNSPAKLLHHFLSTAQGKQLLANWLEGPTASRKLLAYLDAYCWIIGNGYATAPTLLSNENLGVLPSWFEFCRKFATELNDDRTSAEHTIGTGQAETRLNCTIVIRTFDLAGVMVRSSGSSARNTDSPRQPDLCNLAKPLASLLAASLLSPSLIGFNVTDPEVSENLPRNIDLLLQTWQQFGDVSLLTGLKSALSQLLEKRYNLRVHLASFLSSDMPHSEEALSGWNQLINGHSVLLKSALGKDVLKPLIDPNVTSGLLETLISKFSSLKSKTPTESSLLSSAIKLRLTLQSNDASVVKFVSRFITSQAPIDRQVVFSCLTQAQLHSLVSDAMMSLSSPESLPAEGSLTMLQDLLKWFSTKAETERERLGLADRVVENWHRVSSVAESGKMMELCQLLKECLSCSDKVLSKPSALEVVTFYCNALKTTKLDFQSKIHLLDLLPSFYKCLEAFKGTVAAGLTQFVTTHFPMRSCDLDQSSAIYQDYMSALGKILEALKMTGDLMLFKFIITILCSEKEHLQENVIQEQLTGFVTRLQKSNPTQLLPAVLLPYEMFRNRIEFPNQTARIAALHRFCLPILQSCDRVTVAKFFSKALPDIKTTLALRESRVSTADLEEVVLDKTCCFRLVECLYAALLKDELFSPSSQLSKIWIADNPSLGAKPDPWKIMTKELIAYCRNCKNEDMRGETMLLSLRRELHCSAYNALVSVVSSTQTDEKFYQSFLFSGDSTKGVTPLENLMPEIPYTFDVELAAIPARKRKLTSVRQRIEGGNDPSTSETLVYMSTLAESSLVDKLSRYDFSYSQTASQVAMTQDSAMDVTLDDEVVGAVQTTMTSGYIEYESDPLNDHECMSTFTTLLRHMFRNGVTPTQPAADAAVPGWMDWLISKLESDTHINVKHFIARLVLNNESVFQPYSHHWISALVSYITAGTSGLHYFNIDLIVLLIIWTDQAISTTAKLMNSVVEFIMKNLHHDRQAIFKNNLELLKSCTERWKEHISVNSSTIIQGLTCNEDKRIQTAVQTLGVLLTNKINPYNRESTNEPQHKFYGLVSQVLTHRLMSVYSAASEAVGMAVRFLKGSPANAELVEGLEAFTARILNADKVPLEKFVFCVHGISKHNPSFADQFLSKLFFQMKKLHGDLKVRAYEVLVQRAAHIDNVFMQLKGAGFMEVLAQRNSQTMLLCLQILHKIVDKLSISELSPLLPEIARCHNTDDSRVRRVAQAIFMWLYESYNSRAADDPKIKEMVGLAREGLCVALSDVNLENRVSAQNFWVGNDVLKGSAVDRLVGLLRRLYVPDTESAYLSYSCNLLLELTSNSLQFNSKLFDTPLSDCHYEPMAVNASYFQNLSTLASLSDGSTLGTQALPGAAGGLRATQSTLLFSATLDPGQAASAAQSAMGNKTYDWMTQSSVGSGTLDDSQVIGPGSALFAVGRKPIRRQAVGPGFGAPMSSLDATDSISKDRLGTRERALLQRRFVKEKDSNKVFFARRQEQLRKREQIRVAASRAERRNRVTLYRQYRYGDLPDIQIMTSSVIAPLQALAQFDSTVARFLFTSLSKSLLEAYAEATGSKQASQMFTELYRCIRRIMSQSTDYQPAIVAALLEVLACLSSHCTIDSHTVSEPSLFSHQPSVGIVILENEIMRAKVTDRPSASKRQKTSSSAQPSSEYWIELCRLHKSTNNYDVAQSILASQLDSNEDIKKAIEFESGLDYKKAASLYDQVLQSDSMTISESMLALLDDSRIHCMQELASWAEVQDTLLLNLSDDWNSVWQPEHECYIRPMMQSQTHLTIQGLPHEGFLALLRDSKNTQFLEINHGVEMALLSMTNKDFDRVYHYYQLACDNFLDDWKNVNPLLVDTRHIRLQQAQVLAELREFLDVVRNSPDADQANDLVSKWKSRPQSLSLHTTRSWNDIIMYRCFYMNILGSLTDSDRRLADQAMMKLELSDSAIQTGNGGLATNILLQVNKELKENNMWSKLQLRWHMSCVTHSLAQTKNNDVQKLSSLINHVQQALSKLGKIDDANLEVDTSTLIKPFQWYSLKGQTYKIMVESILDSSGADVLACEDQLKELAEVVEADKVLDSLSNKSFDYLEKGWKESGEERYQALLQQIGLADRLIRYQHIEKSGSVEDQTISKLIDWLIECLKAGISQAFTWIPRILQLLELCPKSQATFAEKSRDVPCWVFISWLPQIMSVLDKQVSAALRHIVSEIARLYPMALVYPFKLSYSGFKYTEDLDGSIKSFVRQIASSLSDLPYIDKFVSALYQLTEPKAVLDDWIKSSRSLLGKTSWRLKIAETYKEMYAEILDDSGIIEIPCDSGTVSLKRSAYQKQFSQLLKKKFDSAFGIAGGKITSMTTKSFNTAYVNCTGGTLNKLKAPPGLLKDYSEWLDNWSGEYKQLEMPGQYSGMTKPLPEYHVHISGFNPEVFKSLKPARSDFIYKFLRVPWTHEELGVVLVLFSMRKPKRLVFRGTDERDYRFMVKGGEDLRLDQRIEIVFNNINSILQSSMKSWKLNVRSYSVIPMSPRVGLIEWMDNMATVKELVLDTISEKERKAFMDVRVRYCKQYPDNKSYVGKYSTLSEENCRKWFQDLTSKLPEQIFKRCIQNMSQSVEAFYLLREHFIETYSTLSAAHYVLGVGDRHLSNFMFDKTTAGLVGIDFGHSFGTAVSLLPVPELVPFRLSPLFSQVLEPYGAQGAFSWTLSNVLEVFRVNQHQITNLLDVFIKEPSLDWMSNARKQKEKADLVDDSIEDDFAEDEDDELTWYPKKKVRIARLKLQGAHPAYILCKELKLNNIFAQQSDRLSSLFSHVTGGAMPASSVRLNSKEQANVLVQLSSDGNLMGRMYQGWQDFNI